MCGLAGIVNLNKLDDKAFLERKLNKSYKYLKTRGPDAKGMWHDKNAFFLHTRLKILDLQNTSSQPMESSKFVLSYNGEIYNFKELKKKLNKRFKTLSDTEVILYYYDLYKEKCFEFFEGMWSIVIYDTKQEKIIVTRDRFGEKPLFFLKKNNEI